MVGIMIEQFSPETIAVLEAVDGIVPRLIENTPESLGTDERSILLMSFGSLAIEHYRAMCMLCRSQIAIGSALALFRPMLDAIIRGEWLYRIATDEQIELFMKRRFHFEGIGFKQMTSALDESATPETKVLSTFNEYYQNLCDYTHSGHDAVYHRIAEDGGVEPTYDEDRVRLLLTTATRVIVYHYLMACRYTGHTDEESRLTYMYNVVDRMDEPGFLYAPEK